MYERSACASIALLLVGLSGCIDHTFDTPDAGIREEADGFDGDVDSHVDANAGTGTVTGTGTGTGTGTDSGANAADTDTGAGLTIQEDDRGFCSVDGTVDSDNRGYTGPGFANTENAVGSGTEWKIDLASETSVDVEWTYALAGNGSRPGAVRVNGATRIAQLDFPATGGWESWSTVQASLSLAAGSNIVRLEATTADGLANIDAVTISGTGVSAGDCDADTGSSTDLDTGVDPIAPITIWIAGDSTVATSGGTPCPAGWGGVFAPLFEEAVTVANRAVGGRSVRTWLYHVTDEMDTDGECIIETNADGTPIYQDRWLQMLANMSSGDYLFIQFGINDGARTCDRHVGETQLRLEYGMMAEAAKAAGAHPVFLTPVSMIRCSGNTAIGSRGFIDATFQAGADYDVQVIDLHQLSVDLYNELGFCPLPNGHSDVSADTPGEVGAFFCNDHTHFETPGAEAIAQLVADALRQQAIPLHSYLR